MMYIRFPHFLPVKGKTIMSQQSPEESAFLPTTKQSWIARHGDISPDFVYICGDAYVDHPSFGMAIITRLLEAYGYKVAVIAQPDWTRAESVTLFGEPRLAFLVSSGNMDSMVNHYTVAKKHRKKDAYSPGGQMGLRPDRAVTVYGNLIRKTYKHTPVIIGGIEASLRRLAHYDYWSDSMRRSVLLDSGADLLSYGMGEHSIIAIVEALDSGLAVQDLVYIPGTVYRTKSLENVQDYLLLPSYNDLTQSDEKTAKRTYAESFRVQYQNTDPFTAKTLVEDYGTRGYIVQNPPAAPLTTMEMDDLYALPYVREAHPSYTERGGIPALSEIRYSITSNRGCFGGCNFCALTFHQGRIVQARSHDSILREAQEFLKEPEFKGYIHDVGGPTAQFRHPSCKKQLKSGVCTNRQCLFPKPCSKLQVDHRDYAQLLKKLREMPGVKKVFVRSGIRFDYLLADPDNTFFQELVRYHISGQLRVAPEHVSDRVLSAMGKPEHQTYQRFIRRFERLNETTDKKQYVIPYFMSSHPGCTIQDAVLLGEYVRDMGYMPEQVQDFYPTPSTVSTCMYYTGYHPLTMEKIYVPKNPHEKAMQRALIQYKKPENRKLVREALRAAGREDLIGNGGKCLVHEGQERRRRR